MPFRSRRALSIVCFDTREMHILRHAWELTVDDADANWPTIALVARLPLLRQLHVLGETYLPCLEVAKYRELRKLKVGQLGVTAALFFGAAVAKCDATLRLSNSLSLINLRPLWQQDLSSLGLPRETSAADFAALLGAISLNKWPRTPSLKCCFGAYVPWVLKADDTDDPAVGRLRAVLEEAGAASVEWRRRQDDLEEVLTCKEVLDQFGEVARV